MTFSRTDLPNPSRSKTLLGASLALLSLAQPSFANVLHSFSGEASGDGLGIASRAGDLDGDGIEELILGAPLHDAAGTNAGQVRIVDGATGATLQTWFGLGTDDYFGRSVSALGDVDHDGIDDLAIGAPGAPGSGLPGRVEIRSGHSGAVLFTISGNEPDGAFGYVISATGDVDGDGTRDLFVGAPGETHAGMAGAGRAHLLSGADGSTLATLGGSTSGAAFGQTVEAGPLASDSGGDMPPIGAAIGSSSAVEVFDQTLAPLYVAIGVDIGGSLAWVDDMDGDGIPDLLLGSWTQDRAMLINGMDGSVLLDLTGPEDSAFGHAVAGILDANADGYPDLAIGAPLNDSVFIVSGFDGSTLDTLTGGEFFGWHLAHIGSTRLAVGSPLSENGSGRVEIVDTKTVE